MTHVVIMRGLPGAGKSRYVRGHFPTALVLCPDDHLVGEDGVWRWDPRKVQEAHDWVQAEFSLRLGAVPLIVVDRCSLNWKAIEPYAEGPYRSGHTVELITLLESVGACHKRGLHGVGLATLRLYDKRMRKTRLPTWLKHTQLRDRVLP